MRYNSRLIAVALATSFMAAAAPASAQVVNLTFEGVATTNNTATLDGFYNGGTSSDGNSGPNVGVAFSDNALAINSYNGSGEPDPGILFFLDGADVFINYAAGFDTGFSFFYASNSAAGSATVFDGLNGTGTALGTILLTNNYVSGCGYCQWDPTGVSFSGTARSIGFAGAANFIAFDDVTFGSANPGGGVPEPATWAMMIGGIGMAGSALRRRRAKVKTTVSFV